MSVLPPAILAHILEYLGEASEVIRVASSSKLLWEAATVPLKQVHTLILQCYASDLDPLQLHSLQQRFPNIQQLQLADGSWKWTGGSTLATWAGSLTSMQADDTCFQLAAVVSKQQQSQHSSQHNAGQTAGAVAAVAPTRTFPAHAHPAHACTAQPQPQHAHHTRRTHSRNQHQHHRQQQQLVGEPAVPPELQGLTELQVQRVVTSVVKCRKHGSRECDCQDHTVLAALLNQNAGLVLLNLAGNSGLPDRLLHAASLAASCSSLQTLDLSGCELLRTGAYVPDAFPALARLDISNTAATDADVQAIAAGLPQLDHLALRGCRRVSNYGIDALAAAPAISSGSLTSLDLGGLTRPGAIAMACLTDAWARGCAGRCRSSTASRSTGCSSSSSRSGRGQGEQGVTGVQLAVGFARTACVNDQVLQPLLAQAAAAAGGGGSGSGSCRDDVGEFTGVSGSEAQGHALQKADELSQLLQELEALAVGMPAGQDTVAHQQQQQQQKLKLPQPYCPTQRAAVSLCALHLAGCNAVSASMLLDLGACGALVGLTSLDLCDTEAFRHPLQPQQHQLQQQQQQQQQFARLSSSASAVRSSSSPAPLKSLLPQLMAHTGQQLKVLLLDGCYLDDASAVALAAHGLPQLHELSLVGCRGLGSPGLRHLLESLPKLRHLSIGGSVSAWSEVAVLQGLQVLGMLTQLKLMRRPVLRDTELAPLLVQATSLQALSLVGCYMLTDKVFDLAATMGVQTAPVEQPHVASITAVGDASNSNMAANTTGVEGCTVGVGGVGAVLPLQQHLTQLCITACDGFTGSSIARLQGLKHLRMPFCASLSAAALQHVAVSCKRLRLLELPASLSGQGLGFTAVRFGSNPAAVGQDGGRPSGGRRASSGSGRRGASTRNDRIMGQIGGRGGAGGMVLPQQGSSQAQHLSNLKVTWL